MEVWSANRTENYSKTFSEQLMQMGAKVSLFPLTHYTWFTQVFYISPLGPYKKKKNTAWADLSQ